MARYYKIKIGSIWLTDTGLEAGRPCKVEVENAAALLTPETGNVVVGSDGTPFREKPLTPIGAGRPFSITAAFMTKTVYDALKAALDIAAAANAAFDVIGTGTPGDFDTDAIVFDNPTYIAFASFSGDNLKGVKISLITTAIN